MSIPIPGFGNGAVAPTHDSLAKLRTLGVFQASVTCFADRADFATAVNFSQPWPIDGEPPKFWCNPNANRAPYGLFLSRDENGNYNSRTPNWSGVEGNILSLMASNFLRERPGMKVPVLEVRPISYTEWGRLSFPTEEVADPLDFPIAEVWGITYGDSTNTFYSSLSHTFPSSLILYMKDGVPCVETLANALKEFPTTTIVVSGTAPSSDKAVFVADRLTKSSAARLAALPILNGADTNDVKWQKLLDTIK